MNSQRQHPRTMQQAFGPYTDHQLHPLPDETSAHVGYAIIALAVVSAGLALLFGF